MAEIYLTDEWYPSLRPLQPSLRKLFFSFADNAETECGRLLTEALRIDPNNPEALQVRSYHVFSILPLPSLTFLLRPWRAIRSLSKTTMLLLNTF